MQWLAVSIVLSIVLTLVLNIAVRAFARAGERIDDKLTEVAERRPQGGVYVPWKAMIIISVVLTVGLNLLIWARR